MRIDYFGQTSIHESPYTFYPFIIFGHISLLLSYLIVRIVKNKNFALEDEKKALFQQKKAFFIENIGNIVLFIVSKEQVEEYNIMLSNELIRMEKKQTGKILSINEC